MITPQAIKKAFDTKVRAAGYEKRSGSWWLRGGTVLSVLQLQKSNYDNQFYINMAFHLLAIDPVEPAKEEHCHIRCRADRLLPASDPNVLEILDGASELPVEEQMRYLDRLFADVLSCARDLASEQHLAQRVADNTFAICFVLSEAENFLSAMALK